MGSYSYHHNSCLQATIMPHRPFLIFSLNVKWGVSLLKFSLILELSWFSSLGYGKMIEEY